jgi:hypothetical protein
LGHEFLDEVLTMLSNIAETPLVYPDIHRFSFSIYFRVENAIIVVLANNARESKSTSLEEPHITSASSVPAFQAGWNLAFARPLMHNGEAVEKALVLREQ